MPTSALGNPSLFTSGTSTRFPIQFVPPTMTTAKVPARLGQHRFTLFQKDIGNVPRSLRSTLLNAPKHFTPTLSIRTGNLKEPTPEWRFPLSSNVDIISKILGFVADDQLLFVSLISRVWSKAWEQCPTVTKGVTTETTMSQLLHSFSCGLARTRQVCQSVARFGKLDLFQLARAKYCPWHGRTRLAA